MSSWSLAEATCALRRRYDAQGNGLPATKLCATGDVESRAIESLGEGTWFAASREDGLGLREAARTKYADLFDGRGKT
jgi:hypothetical protein